MNLNLILGLALLASITISEGTHRSIRKHPKAIFKTCSCSLSKFPDLKEFLETDLPEYGDLLSVVYEKNALPKMNMLDEEGNETGMVMLEKLTRKQIRDLLKEVGIEPYFTLEEISLETSEL